MIRLVKLIPAAQLQQPPYTTSDRTSADHTIKDQLVLTFDERKRSRLRVKSVNQQDCGIQISRGQILQHHDVLVSDQEQYFEVIAALEPLMRVENTDPLTFAKLCYHLGNRHVALQIEENWLQFSSDHVLAEMVVNLGGSVQLLQARFAPEAGAYARADEHQHDHAH